MVLLFLFLQRFYGLVDFSQPFFGVTIKSGGSMVLAFWVRLNGWKTRLT